MKEKDKQASHRRQHWKALYMKLGLGFHWTDVLALKPSIHPELVTHVTITVNCLVPVSSRHLVEFPTPAFRDMNSLLMQRKKRHVIATTASAERRKGNIILAHREFRKFFWGSIPGAWVLKFQLDRLHSRTLSQNKTKTPLLRVTTSWPDE